MLNNLNISDFAIIEQTQISFHKGLNILSGETGAGKSILIDAISLIRGGRADNSLIRHGASKASISAEFSGLSSSLLAELEQAELIGFDDRDQLLIRRSLRDKSSKCFVNSQAVTSTQLRELLSGLINIHGQNSSQTLLTSEGQRERLDNFAANGQLLERIAQEFRAMQKLKQEIKTLQESEKLDQERRELLDYQLAELAEANLEQGEFSQLAQKHRLLASAAEVLRTAGSVVYSLEEDESNPQKVLSFCAQTLSKLASSAPHFAEAGELLAQSNIYLEEALDSLKRAVDATHEDPEEFARIDARMSQLHRLANKHKVHADDLFAKYEQLQSERETLDARRDKSVALLDELHKLEKNYRDLCREISQRRQAAAQDLAAQVQELIRSLGMKEAIFAVVVRDSERDSVNGRDEIEFQLCANPGQILQGISKIASGGELSRISLAIEVASFAGRSPELQTEQTLIFDEIDAGIGGETADSVGRLLAKLSRFCQVLCITHLPQVAVYANHHFLIEKYSDTDTTQTQVRELSPAERVGEIARMLGSSNSKVSQKHAQEMLKQAENLMNK